MDQLVKLTLAVPRLKISIKSFRKGAPELPPPPKIWVMTMLGEADGEGEGDGVGVGEGDGVGPPINTDAELLSAPSAVTINTDLPAPRRSAGTMTFI